MPDQITVYVQVEGDPQDQAERMAAEVRALQSVTDVKAHPEEPVRSGVEVIQEITLTVTALTGTVAATAALVDRIRDLLGKFRVTSAQAEIEGRLTELSVGAPRNEKPAQ